MLLDLQLIRQGKPQCGTQLSEEGMGEHGKTAAQEKNHILPTPIDLAMCRRGHRENKNINLKRLILVGPHYKHLI